MVWGSPKDNRESGLFSPWYAKRSWNQGKACSLSVGGGKSYQSNLGCNTMQHTWLLIPATYKFAVEMGKGVPSSSQVQFELGLLSPSNFNGEILILHTSWQDVEVQEEVQHSNDTLFTVWICPLRVWCKGSFHSSEGHRTTLWELVLHQTFFARAQKGVSLARENLMVL